MITCNQGHEVSEGASFCSVCGEPITVEVGPQSDAATPVDASGSWLTNRKVVIGLGALFVLGVVGAILASVLGGHGTKPTDSSTANSSTTPLSASDNCIKEEINFLGQVPAALRAGYQAGVSTQQLSVQYGYGSPIVEIANTLQGELLVNVNQRGDPEGQVNALLPEVASRCAAAFPGTGGSTPTVPAETPTFAPTLPQTPGNDGCIPDASGSC